MNSPARETQREHAHARLAALKSHLSGRGILARHDPRSLAILDDRGVQLDTITCELRGSDGGRMWFANVDGWLTEADDVTGAGLMIAGDVLRPRG